jgi:hypothetical protein
VSKRRAKSDLLSRVLKFGTQKAFKVLVDDVVHVSQRAHKKGSPRSSLAHPPVRIGNSPGSKNDPASFDDEHRGRDYRRFAVRPMGRSCRARLTVTPYGAVSSPSEIVLMAEPPFGYS